MLLTQESFRNALSQCGISKGSTVYDIGCGSGRNMMYPDLNFIGVDNCENLLKICRDKGLNVVYGDMCNLPVRDNSADYIISVAAFPVLSCLAKAWDDKLSVCSGIKSFCPNVSRVRFPSNSLTKRASILLPF